MKVTMLTLAPAVPHSLHMLIVAQEHEFSGGFQPTVAVAFKDVALRRFVILSSRFRLVTFAALICEGRGR